MARRLPNKEFIHTNLILINVHLLQLRPRNWSWREKSDGSNGKLGKRENARHAANNWAQRFDLREQWGK